MVSRRVFFLFGDLGASGGPTNLTQCIHRCINKSFCQHGIVLVFGGYSSRSTSPLYGIQRPKWPSLPKHDTMILIDQNRGHGEWKDVAWPPLRRQARSIAFLLPRRQCYARGPDSLRAPQTVSLGPPLVQPPAGEAQGCQGGCMLWWRQSGVGPGLGWRRRFQRKHRRRC